MRITQAEARKLTASIKTGLANIEQQLRHFHAVQGWFPLGYESFVEWWDAELGTIPISMGLRNWVIFVMVDSEPKTPGGYNARGLVGAVAQVMGTSSATVREVVRERNRHRSTLAGKLDHEHVSLGFLVPKLWRRHLVKLAADKNVNMADILRTVVRDGIRERYGVDLEKPIKSSAPRR